ncbi:MAG: glycosyltransferase family 2 protein [Candidatus Gracilibacteria bacterium]|nr:glycosyltransferase family 2 protein [Candidatus Gracilibacteria bacterium]
MKLSIITCTYNSEKYLEKCIESVKNQKLNNSIYEHIFIDGCSKDNTINIINKYKSENTDTNIIVVQKEPKGIYNAMNSGVNNSKGEYITFLNSDDYYNDKVLNDYLNFVENDGNKELYYGINNIVDNEGNIKTEYPNKGIYKKGLNKYILAMACYIFQSNTLYKKSLHDKYGLYNENLKLVSDAEFFVKLAKGNISNIFYNKVIANFRMHDGSASKNINLQENELEKVRINIFGNMTGNFMNLIYKILKKILIKQ